MAIGLQWWADLNLHAMHCNFLVIQYNSWEDAKNEKKNHVFIVKSLAPLLISFATSRKITKHPTAPLETSLDHNS